MLNKYDIFLDEDEKTILISCFSIQNFPGLLDIHKIFTYFENFQNALTTQQTQYCVEWERRMFKKIGDYLKQNNMTISQCFKLIDQDGSGTLSVNELITSFCKFNLGVPEREVKILVNNLDTEGRGYITRNTFL